MPYIIAIVVIIVAAAGFAFMQNKNTAPDITVVETSNTTGTDTDTEGTETAAADTTTTEPTPVEAVAQSDYKDGTYRSQVTYFTPNRDEYLIDVSLTIKDDVVSAANVAYSQGAEIDPNAQRFEGAYRTEVVGKEVDSLNLSRVGGASLTTGAFNKALAEIKADAEA